MSTDDHAPPAGVDPARWEAYIDGRPYAGVFPCIACGSIRVLGMVRPLQGRRYEGCLDCKAFWEARGPDWCDDVVCAKPCDNCAFRPGSPERKDPKKWEALMQRLFLTGGQFFCHKGVPVNQAKDDAPDNIGGKAFLFDMEQLRRGEGAPFRYRLCAGYVAALAAKPRVLAKLMKPKP